MKITAAVVPSRGAPFELRELDLDHPFADIEQAFADSAAGRTLKPVLRFDDA